VDGLRSPKLPRGGGLAAADAIRTTDTVVKDLVPPRRRPGGRPQRGAARGPTATGYAIGGMAQGRRDARAGPGHDAVRGHHRRRTCPAAELDAALRSAVGVSFDRLDTDGCMSTKRHRAAAGQRRRRGGGPIQREFTALLTEVCADLARQLQLDAEGRGQDDRGRGDRRGQRGRRGVRPPGERWPRSNLLKCAIAGEDPNWGRVVLRRGGTTAAEFDPDRLNVAINGIWVCRNGCAGDERSKVDMSPAGRHHHRRPVRRAEHRHHPDHRP